MSPAYAPFASLDVIVMYHYVRDAEKTPFPGIKACPIDRFEEQVGYLSKTHTCVTLGEYRERRHERTEKPYAVLTFDDGVRDHLDTVVPILNQHGVPATFFIITKCLEGQWVAPVHKVHFLLSQLDPSVFLSELESLLAARGAHAYVATVPPQVNNRWDDPVTARLKYLVASLPNDVKELVLAEIGTKHLGDEADFARSLYISPKEVLEMHANGFEIAAHTHTHRLLTQLSEVEQRFEITESIRILRECIQSPIRSFSYPNGVWSPFAESVLVEEGVAAAVTVEVGSNTPTEPSLRLKRFDTNDIQVPV